MSTPFPRVFSSYRRLPSLVGVRQLRELGRIISRVCLILCVLALLPVLYYFLPAVSMGWARAQEEWRLSRMEPVQLEKDAKLLQAEIVRLKKETAKLQKAMAKRLPRGPYIAIDTHTNTFLMREGDQVLREGICATGSGKRLTWVEGNRIWVFNTPKGKHKVRARQEGPVWKKPDWAFVEEGERIPGPNAPERFEEGVMGEYALDFGRGYKIHGTPYKRTLGMYVSHGCVRLDDEDLEFVYNRSPIGTEIYIF